MSRNIFFYKEINLDDSYETRVYLIFLHYSIVLFIQKNRGDKPDQMNYNNLFFFIENNLRELGFGDVAVNKKMKDLNKIFYDILIKISQNQTKFLINKAIFIKYFTILNNNEKKLQELLLYFNNFYHFCFELPSDNMIKEIQNYKV